MARTKRPRDPFDWSGGHPALDLVNTLDERPYAPIEMLASYSDLVRFAELSGLIDPSLAQKLRLLDGPACTRVVRRARELREHLHAVLSAHHAGSAVVPSSLDAIATAVRRAHAARALMSTRRPRVIAHCWVSPFSA